jgi:hypothetical protein
MPARLTPPTEQTFVLSRTDKLLGNDGEPTTVKIAQATQGQHDERMQLWAEFSRSYDEDGQVEVKQKISPAVVRRTEVFLTLKACNLEWENGSPVFTFPLKANEFNKAWGALLPAVAEEIHEKVLEVNVLWSGEVGEAE